MAQLLDALGHAHDRGVWHRDIKPSNLVIMKDGRLKIADFGIARIEGSDVTQTFPMMGTPGYMPPEMYRGEAGDQQADIFAAGAVMYQLLSGRAPFEGTAESVMFNVCHQDPPPMEACGQTRRWAHYDAALAAALSKSADRRFASAAAFRDALLAAFARPVSPAVSQQAVLAASGHGPDDLTPDTGAPTVRLMGIGSARTPWPQAWDAAAPGAETPRAKLLGPMAHTPLAAEEIEWAARALAQHIGPLARLIVKRASAQTSETEQFYLRVIEAISSESDREAFLRDVRSAGRPACR
jgi:hypothetical protein